MVLREAALLQNERRLYYCGDSRVPGYESYSCSISDVAYLLAIAIIDWPRLIRLADKELEQAVKSKGLGEYEDNGVKYREYRVF